MAAVKQHSDRDYDRYMAEVARVEEAVENGDVSDTEGETILDFLRALDPDVMTVDPGDVGTKKYSTIYSYAQALRLVATRTECDLMDIDADGLNETMDEWDLSNNTKLQRQSALRGFYRWCDACDLDPEDIIMAERDESQVDDRYIFDREEIDAMRAEIDNDRDRCVLDMLLYTGQRIRAILSLRIKDMNLDEGTFYLNTDEHGLKGASGKRPLLAARDAAIEWMDNHPAADDPDAYFITKLPGASKGDPHSMLYRSTIERRIKQIAKDAGIENAADRAHPHNFRHTFVTWAKRVHGMDDSTIKAILGQAPDSRIMEATYQHLSDDDVIEAAQAATGRRDLEPDENPLIPESCPICDRTLRHDDRVCGRCGNEVTHEAQSAKEEIDSDLKQDYRDTDPEDTDTMDKLDTLDELLDDPEVKAALLEKLDED